MKNTPKLVTKKGISHNDESESIDAYVGQNALRQCGGVYVISRRDGLVKVGITEGDFARRFKEIAQASRSAGIVGIQPEILVPMDEGMANVESAVHKKLCVNREGGEWFRMTAEEAVRAVLSAAFRQRCRNAEGRKVIELGEMDKPRLAYAELWLLNKENPGCINVAHAASVAARNIDNLNNRVEIFCRIASALALIPNDIPPVRGFFNAAIDLAEKISNPKYRASALCRIAKVAAESMDRRILGERIFASALSVAESITVTEEHDKILRHIAHTQAKVGDISAALSTAQNIGDSSSFAVALQLITSTRPSAEGIESILSIARSIEEEKRAHALSSVVEGLLVSEEFNDALSVAHEINEGFWHSDALANVMSAQAKAGNIDAAISMIPNIGSASYPKISVSSMAKIAVVQMKAGQTKEARNTFSAALSAVSTDDLCRHLDLRTIAIAQAEVGDIHGALATAQSMDAKRFERKWTLRDIASAQANAGDIDGALATARSIDNAIGRAGSLHDIALAQSKSGDIDSALEIAQSIDNTDWHAGTWRDIASVQAEAGDFQAAIKTALEINDSYARASALTNIAKYMAVQESRKS